jgi:AcrR family transcriptional regulator
MTHVASTAGTQPPPRRERQRQQTVTEITATANRLLLRDGVVGVTLRSIAREMGMTAPGLYRYFDSHEAVVTALAAQLYDDVRDALCEARDAQPPDDVTARLIEVCRAFRSWALGHRAEFGLLFANPITDPARPATDVCEEAGRRFGLVFGDLFTQLWQQRPFPVPAQDDLDGDLVAQLRSEQDLVTGDVPIGAVYVFLRCWARLYGTVTLEVFGHLGWALDDTSAIFEDMLTDNAAALGALDDYHRLRTPRPPG